MRRLNATGIGAGTLAVLIGRRGRRQPPASERKAPCRWSAISTLVVATSLLTFASTRLAAATVSEEFSITIPIDTVVEAPEGSATVLATEPVGEQFVGQVCTVAAQSENQESVHPGNDLVVESGSSVVRLEEVESGAGTVVIAEGELELGSEIVVSLVMGPDEIFSAGVVVHVECIPTEATTTTTTEATTTTTNEATTTTTNDEVASTTSPPEETTSTVEDEVRGTIITTTTVGDEVEAVEVLPLTGSDDGALLLAAASVLALGGILLVGSRREED